MSAAGKAFVKWFDQQPIEDQRKIAIIAIGHLIETDVVTFFPGDDPIFPEDGPRLIWSECGDELVDDELFDELTSD